MFNKTKNLLEKELDVLRTNDDYIVSDYFSNPMTVKRHLNMAK